MAAIYYKLVCCNFTILQVTILQTCKVPLSNLEVTILQAKLPFHNLVSNFLQTCKFLFNLSSKTYEFNLEVKDTKGETTTVESKLQATDPIGPFVG